MATRVEVVDGKTGERIDIHAWNARRSAARIAANDPFDPSTLERVLLRRLGSVHRAQERRLFATEGADGGERWAALSVRYAAEKLRAVGRRKILVRTGKLRNAMTKASDPAHIARLRGPRNRPVFEFGAISEVGYKHTHTGIQRSDGVVKRSVIQKTDAQANALRAEVADYFTKRYTEIILQGYGLKPRPISDRARAAAGID